MTRLSILLLVALFVGNQLLAQRSLQIAKQFIDKPYVAKTLEVNNEESLVINLDEVDCTTFVEYVAAKALTSNPADSLLFAKNLKKIRYRNGVIDGYPSRLHYISGWIENGEQQGIIEDITKLNSPSKQTLSIYYMSAHPQQYTQLKSSSENLQKIKEVEERLNGKEISWLPKDSIPLNGLPYIKDGDIIALVTNIPGLDVSHLGFAVYNQKNELCLLHASSKHKKVLVDPLPLQKLLSNSKGWTGIRVFRIKN